MTQLELVAPSSLVEGIHNLGERGILSYSRGFAPLLSIILMARMILLIKRSYDIQSWICICLCVYVCTCVIFNHLDLVWAHWVRRVAHTEQPWPPLANLIRGLISSHGSSTWSAHFTISIQYNIQLCIFTLKPLAVKLHSWFNQLLHIATDCWKSESDIKMESKSDLEWIWFEDTIGSQCTSILVSNQLPQHILRQELDKWKCF